MQLIIKFVNTFSQQNNVLHQNKCFLITHYIYYKMLISYILTQTSLLKRACATRCSIGETLAVSYALVPRSILLSFPVATQQDVAQHDMTLTPAATIPPSHLVRVICQRLIYTMGTWYSQRMLVPCRVKGNSLPTSKVSGIYLTWTNP